MLVKTLYPEKVPQAIEISILSDRFSKTGMKGRVVNGVIYILNTEKLVLNFYVFGICFLEKTACHAMIAKMIAMLDAGQGVHRCGHF